MRLDPARLTDTVALRPATAADAAPLAEACRRSRAHLEPWEPVRPEEYFTPRGQEARLRQYEEQRAAGLTARWLLWDTTAAHPEVAGGITLSNVTLGPFRSANLGYWIDVGYVGRGLATAAVEAVCAASDARLGLHRLEAGTLVDNAASQRVLAKCGFTRFGLAPAYLHINGAWRDHRLFQRLLNDRAPHAV
ncbi:GNAT family N-acetyltransferase [Streptomyces longispororuber]|uniref:GNAT family N-acetyltransferase n=1 Tax=Streptomyces longispororuber TaxID=68230 RepID=UPI0036F7A1E2